MIGKEKRQSFGPCYVSNYGRTIGKTWRRDLVKGPTRTFVSAEVVPQRRVRFGVGFFGTTKSFVEYRVGDFDTIRAPLS